MREEMESKIDHLMELLKEAGSLANELAAEGIPIKLIAMLEEESGEKEPPRISALRKLLKTNFSDDAMELMLEHPEREFTYRYGRGVSKRKEEGAERMSKEVAEKIDKVICELSEDIMSNIKEFPCDNRAVAEKAQALAALIDANARAHRNCTRNDQGSQPEEDLFPARKRVVRSRKIKRVEIEINFQEPVDGLNITKAVRNFRRQCRELMDAEVHTRYSYDGAEEPGLVELGQGTSKESPEIDVERMQELLRSTPLTCIPIEKPEEIQESVDAVIRALSEDIICTIGRENGIQCAKEVEEKTLTLATLVNMRIALGKSELLETGKGGK